MTDLRLCENCSHLHHEHGGADGECDCCRCPHFTDEPDYQPTDIAEAA